MNKIALITGATSGIGEAFARKLAREHYDLIITGRRVEKINALAQELTTKHDIKVEVIIAELADPKDLSLLEEKVKNLKNLDLLINNAGFNIQNYFAKEAIKTAENMLNAHVLTTIKLTQAALINMLTKDNGNIINVSSIVAFYPFVTGAMYAGTKACINLFTESVYQELKKMGSKIHIQVLCPGIVVSDFHPRMNLDLDAKKVAASRNFLWHTMPADEVVTTSLKYLTKGKVICVPGFLNRVIVLIKTLKRLGQVFF